MLVIIPNLSFFFFYGGSLMDVASQTAWRNSPLSSACLPASTHKKYLISELINGIFIDVKKNIANTGDMS